MRASFGHVEADVTFFGLDFIDRLALLSLTPLATIPLLSLVMDRVLMLLFAGGAIVLSFFLGLFLA